MLLIRFTICCLILFSANTSFSLSQTENLILNSQLNNKPYTPEIEFLEDINRDINVKEAMELAQNDKFGAVAANFNLGFKDSRIWVHFPLIVKSLETLPHFKILLEFNYPAIDRLVIYRSSGESKPVLIAKLGDHIEFSQRGIASSSLLVADTVKTNKNYDYWLLLDTTSSVQLHPSIWSYEHYIEKDKHSNLAYGAFFGILLVMAIYNIFLGITVRDTTYLLYSSYIVSFALFQASLSGHAYQYLWPTYPELNKFAIPVFIILATGFGLSFTRAFLQTNINSPKMDKALRLLSIICYSMVILFLFIEHRISVILCIIFGLLTVITILIAVLSFWNKGLYYTRLYFIAWVTLLAGVITIGLTTASILPSNIYTQSAIQVGSLIEVVLLSFALAYRINITKEEKKQIQIESKNILSKKNKELESALRLITKSNKLKDVFLATLSHELRTPMNGIEGSLQIIEEELTDPDKKLLPHVRAASSSAHHMTNLVEGLLDYSELQSDTLKLQQLPFSLDKLVNALEESVINECKDKGIEFSVSVSNRPCHKLSGDPSRIRNMVIQLLDNALKFTSSGSIKLAVDLLNQKNGVSTLSFQVIDTGLGIPPDKLKSILEGFYQMDGSFSRQHGGLGIGLSL